MSKPNHWGQALTAIGLVTALAACSTGMSGTNSASSSGAKVDLSKVGLATRAQVALASNDFATALTLAESAVEYRPQEASFRALLGNVYFASGRFASAEQAYSDSLSLSSAQPQVILKLALVQVALGKSNQAGALLASAQSLLDPTDLGLALALAGRPDQAVAVLEPAARAIGADARTRQNLALAYGFGGDWQAARTIAAQDLAANEVDARIDQWLGLAKPGQAGAQVAALIGIVPAASDPGQPVRLALNANAEPTRVAELTPAPVAAPVAVEAPYVAPVEVAAAVVEAPVVAPAQEAASVAPVVAALPTPAAAPRRVAALRAARPGLTPAAARLSPSLAELRHAALVRPVGRSRAVVQLGAYGSRNYIAGAWTRASAKYGALRNFTPVTARYDGPKGTFYRLSVKGFASDRQAIALCSALKRSGGKCFVRAAFNDAPIQFASR
ncbi:MAG: tetratricopeptide repeat protein [Sphingomonas bacterium]|nr:tetratricopeptide repeat protein [Sphingomonas bacterium]